MRKLSALSLRIKGAHNIISKHTHIHTHTHTHTQNKSKNKQANLTTDYALCGVNTEDTIRHNIALMTSASRVYII